MVAMAMIRDFYQDKIVLLTGCTCFLGKVLLELSQPPQGLHPHQTQTCIRAISGQMGISFDPQTIYYKGNADSQPPPDIDQIVRPVEGRVLKKLKARDMVEDEEMQQATERHDEILLG